jgi:hypothetical protein
MFRVLEASAEFTAALSQLLERLTVNMTQQGLYQVQQNRMHFKLIKQTTLYAVHVDPERNKNSEELKNEVAISKDQ